KAKDCAESHSAAAVVWLPAMGVGVPRALCRILARARQRVLVRLHGSDRISTAFRSFAAQRVVPYGRHGRGCGGGRSAHGMVSAGPRAVSDRLGAVGSRLRTSRETLEKVCCVSSCTGWLFGGDTVQPESWRD